MTIVAELLHDSLDPTLTGERLRQQMLADFPDFDPARLTVLPTEKRSENHLVNLMYDERLIAVMGAPISVGIDLTQFAQVSMLWPDHLPVPSDCGGRTIVSILRPNDDTLSRAEETRHIAAIDDATLLSKTMAAAIAVSDSIVAVHFGSAEHVVAPATFRELALETSSGSLPSAWISRNIASAPDGSVSGYTRGMDMLGLMDIEIIESSESPEDTFMRLTDISTYQLQNGPVIGDGDSLGATEDVELIASHAPSVHNPDKPVLRLAFANNEVTPTRQKRRWFRRK